MPHTLRVAGEALLDASSGAVIELDFSTSQLDDEESVSWADPGMESHLLFGAVRKRRFKTHE